MACFIYSFLITKYVLQIFRLLNTESKYIFCLGNIKTSKVKSANDSADTASEIPLHDPLFKIIRDLHIKDVGKQIAETLGTLRDERAVCFIYYSTSNIYWCCFYILTSVR